MSVVQNALGGAFGRVSATLGTFHNENSVSLANLNFDFTLVKLEAPKEFSGLGSSISRKRKTDAEDGALHKAARKLGALFEPILPSTPALFRAYGTRVSEISQSAAVNPQGSDKDGLFSKQIGADSTSIWAAVTSGDGAIAVHLLACMLARMFTAEEATSIWDELVRAQKQWIQKQITDATFPHKYDASLLAAQQDILRADLGNWDASARSWLQSADQAKAREHKQLMLILENASIPVNNEPNLHTSVTKAWTTALQAMNNLVQGIPQQVSDGAALLGISSWHMYPNLVVLGLGQSTVDVEQRDTMFPDTAVITLGIQVISESHKSMSWSLPLAYLRYYGRPVKTSRSAGQENSRISMEQFLYVILGCVFEKWEDFALSLEEGTNWLEQIADLLSEGMTLHRSLLSVSWLGHLLRAAKTLHEIDGIDKRFAMQLLSLGQRRSEFLSGLDSPPPLFGLSDASVLVPLMKNSAIRVSFLRNLAADLNLQGDRYIIRYHTGADTAYPYEYTTVQVPRSVYGKRTLDGLPKETVAGLSRHIRWVPVPVELMHEIYYCSRTVKGISGGLQPRVGIQSPETPESMNCKNCRHTAHRAYCKFCAASRTAPLWARHREIEQFGESCRLLLETTIGDQSMSALNESRYVKFGQGGDFATDLETFTPETWSDRLSVSKFAQFSLFIGDLKTAAILEIVLAPSFGRSQPVIPIESRQRLLPKQVAKVLRPDILDVKDVISYFGGSDIQSQSWNYYDSLKACAAAAEVFKFLTNATVSTTILSQPLYRSKWVPRDQPSSTVFTLSRPQIMACIAMFDSGTCDLDPTALKEVFAMSLGNSIYVANAMLCDPIEVTDVASVRRVIGNLGRAGISLLIPPADPAVRIPEGDDWMQVNHVKFDGTVEDSFQHTSIHLSLTGYEMPLSIDSGSNHIIDRPASLLETLVSVLDRGKWVADLDIINMLCGDKIHRLVCNNVSTPYYQCRQQPKKPFKEVFANNGLQLAPGNWTCIDNWDEFLDPPQRGVMVVRGHCNWLARLAFTALALAQSYQTFVLPGDICWPCCKTRIEQALTARHPEQENRKIVLIG